MNHQSHLDYLKTRVESLGREIDLRRQYAVSNVLENVITARLENEFQYALMQVAELQAIMETPTP